LKNASGDKKINVFRLFYDEPLCDCQTTVGSSINDVALRGERGERLKVAWRCVTGQGGLKVSWRHARYICGKAQWTAKFTSPTGCMWQDE